MTVRLGRPYCSIFCILLESGCSPTIVNGKFTQKLKYKPDESMEWKKQAGNFMHKCIVNL